MDNPNAAAPTPDRAPTFETRPRTTSPPSKRPSFGDYHPDDYVSRKVAAALIGVSAGTLEDWAREGKSPPYCKLGEGRSSRVVMRVGSLLEFMESRTRASTTVDPGAS